MKYKIRYKPSFSTVFATLNPGDSITAEAGAMTSMDTKLSIKTELSGGFFSAILKGFFGREPLFVNHFMNNTDEPLEVVLSHSIISDIVAIELQKGQELYLQPGAYIASTDRVKLGVAWAGFASWLVGVGLFKLKVTGPGIVFFGVYGGITEMQINREFIINQGHLLAYDPGIKMKVSMVGNLWTSITSQEGFVNKVNGNGTIYLHTRSMNGMVNFLGPRCR